VIDQIAKTVAEHGLRDRTIELGFGPKLLLTYNSGAAFSIGSGRSGFFTVVASTTIVVLIAYAVWLRQRPWQAVAFGLIIGGAAGNVVDRLARDNGGRVIDFIQLAKWWPVFNVADMCLFFGVALMLLLSFRTEPTS
jgi:signal peptidase II